MDDFLIIISYLMVIPLIVLAWPWLSAFSNFTEINDYFQAAPVILGSRLNAIIIYGAGAVSSQIAGRIIRFKEKESLKILDTLNFYKKTTVSQLSSQLEMPESKVSSLVRKMSRISSLGICIEGEQITIGLHKEHPATEDNYSSFSSSEASASPLISQFEKVVNQVKSGSDIKDAHNSEELKKAAQNLFKTAQIPAIINISTR